MMPIVPTTLVRITRFYLLTALGYLILTLLVAATSAALPAGIPAINPDLFWYAGVLGWVSLPIMGAFYQFFPTLQGQDLNVERLSFVQYALVNIGLVGILGSVLAGSIVAIGIFTAVYAIGAFLLAFILLGKNLTPSKMTLTLKFYTTAVLYFVAGTAILALNNLGLTALGRPVVSHLLLLGWAVMAIFGAQYIMVPMLQLKTLAWERLASIQYYVANLGVIVLALGFAGVGTAAIAAGGALEFVAIILFVAVIVRSITSGPSRLKKMDLSVLFFMGGNAYLVLVALLGIAIALFPLPLQNVHMRLALIGVMTNTIVGAMYHILPFLVWWETYAGKVGAERVPLLKELFNEPFARTSFYLWNGSLWLMVAGFISGLSYLVVIAALTEVILAAALLGQMLNLVASHKQDGESKTRREGGSAFNPTTTGGI